MSKVPSLQRMKLLRHARKISTPAAEPESWLLVMPLQCNTLCCVKLDTLTATLALVPSPSSYHIQGDRDYSHNQFFQAMSYTSGQDFDLSKFSYLLHLPIKLNPTNLRAWQAMMQANLEAAGLFKFCTTPANSRKADALVRAILLSNMTEEIIKDTVDMIGPDYSAYTMWEHLGDRYYFVPDKKGSCLIM
ncbi:hypothetical protein APHAL10511_004116 [Amanita phalloides]|nr:hypothetical protein APHAL10511_004116 [Amanita phalloides]